MRTPSFSFPLTVTPVLLNPALSRLHFIQQSFFNGLFIMSEQKTVLITGASSGFGLLTSVTLAKRGWRVLATMRDLNRREKLENAARDAGVLERIEFHVLDVTNAEQIAAIAEMVAQRGEPLN